MNFIHMPELTWKYGNPAVTGAGVPVALVCLWIMKKKSSGNTPLQKGLPQKERFCGRPFG